MNNEYIELELMNGNGYIFQKDWNKVYILEEKTLSSPDMKKFIAWRVNIQSTMVILR